MEIQEQCTEEELAELLPDDPELFLQLLHEDYGRRISDLIRRVLMGCFTPEDGAEVYQETIMSVWETIRSSDYDPHQSPMAMVNTIAKRRAIDCIRKKTARTSAAAPVYELSDALIDSLPDTNLRHDLLIADEDERKLLIQAVLEIIDGLKNERERLAATAFVAVADEVTKNNIYTPLRIAISRLSGREVTVASAKSAWIAARSSIRASLRSRGFTAIGGRDE